jgi:hypothetical protein
LFLARCSAQKALNSFLIASVTGSLICFWILIYSGLPHKTYTTICAQEENEKRFWPNLLVFKALRSFFYASVLSQP